MIPPNRFDWWEALALPVALVAAAILGGLLG